MSVRAAPVAAPRRMKDVLRISCLGLSETLPGRCVRPRRSGGQGRRPELLSGDPRECGCRPQPSSVSKRRSDVQWFIASFFANAHDVLKAGEQVPQIARPTFDCVWWNVPACRVARVELCRFTGRADI